MFLDLRDAQNFFDGRLARFDLVPTIRAQRAHAGFDGALGDGRGGRAVHDERAQRFRDEQQFINAFAALITLLAAIFATRAVPELRGFNVRFRKTDRAADNRGQLSARSCNAGRSCG